MSDLCDDLALSGPGQDFWRALDGLVETCEIVIDRPAGSRHPRFPSIVYPLDYGYLRGTTAIDGGGVDVWSGSLPQRLVTAVVATVDLVKRDAEVKLLIGCSRAEMDTVSGFHNDSDKMKGLLIVRPG